MARNKPYSGATLVAMLAALLLAVGAVACAPTVRATDLTAVAKCPGEDGPGAGPFPCVWDSQTQGNGQAGPYDVRWTFYAGPDGCPNVTQDNRLWHCVLLADWSGQ